MNRALAEMLHCLNTPANLAGNSTDTTVLERQRARMKCQQEQLHQQPPPPTSFFDGNEFSVFSTAETQKFQGFVPGDMGLNEFVTRAVKADPGLDNGWAGFSPFGGEVDSGLGPSVFGIGSGLEMSYGISRTASCPPPVAVAAEEAAVAETKQRESNLQEKISSAVGRESFKKRKADKTKAVAEEDSRDKRVKGCPEQGETKTTEQNSNQSKNTNNNNNSKKETSADTSRENSKLYEVQKPDYIHVRARRGQATDSHSLAERVRREKISERMKYLQDLVPGCNKITGKAGMLDEIINYVQSLQRQVEFLSMKLAAVNPTLDFNVNNFFTKEVFPPFPPCTSNFPIEVSQEIANQAYLQFNPLQQLVSCGGLDMGINASEMALRRAISAPVSIPETFLDSSCFSQTQSSSAWDANLKTFTALSFSKEDQLHFQPSNLQVPI